MNAGAQRRLARRVDELKRWLTRAYRLDVRFEAEHYLIAPERARALLPLRSPRSGLLVLQEAETLWLGLYLDPRDRSRVAALVEETSHLVCLAWHARRELPVSRLLLELQADVDRFVFSRLVGERSERDALTHFESFRWADGLEEDARDRYELAHRRAHHYCRRLNDRYPRRADTPALLSELRRFYRSSPESKLRAA